MKADQASRLADLRRKTDYTLRDIEEKLRQAGIEIGVSYSRLAKFEKDASIRIKRSVLAELARIYKTTVDFILYGEAGPPPNMALLAEAVESHRAASVTGRVRGKTATQAERLKALRDRAELNQVSAAEKATELAGRPVTYQNIDKWEREPAVIINPVVLRALAEVYRSTAGYIKTGVDAVEETALPFDTAAQLLQRLGDADTVVLPFVPFTAYGSFIMNCQDHTFQDLQTVRILRIDGLSYENAVVIEVRGNSMADRYPDRSRHVVRPASEGNWQYATGVHAVSLSNEMFVIKRITSNKDGIIILTSDSNGEQMTIQLSDIHCMWKVGESVYMPAED